jgi:hypothetical protein
MIDTTVTIRLSFGPDDADMVAKWEHWETFADTNEKLAAFVTHLLGVVDKFVGDGTSAVAWIGNDNDGAGFVSYMNHPRVKLLPH